MIRICKPIDSILAGAPLTVEEVERIAAVGEEVVAGGESAATEFQVVGRQAVRHDQMRLALDAGPVWQLVVIRIRVVQETTFLHQQPPGVQTGSVTAVPAQAAALPWFAAATRPRGGCDPARRPRTIRSASPIASRGSRCRTRRRGSRLRRVGVAPMPKRSRTRSAADYVRRTASDAPERDPAGEHTLGGEVAPGHPRVEHAVRVSPIRRPGSHRGRRDSASS